VKVLFVLGATSRIRNFRESILALADQGHTFQLAGRPRGGVFGLPPDIEHPRVTGRVNPTERSDAWREFVDLLRGARDYVRYFDPRYGHATRLRQRAYEIAPTEFVLYCEQHPWIKRHWKTVGRALSFCEDLIPTDRGFEAFVREETPDLMLVTPLVTFESYQTDYVKVAHELGIPTVFIPFSWDNLTNKGLVRVQPDRVFVWNEVQRKEAIDLHGCRPEDVVVTGAERFDGFFAMQPSVTREAFFAEFGLDPRRPLILYLGSSQLTGPNEMELLRRWAESIRASKDEVVRQAAILVRPHPALRRSYASVDYSDLGGVAFSLDASPRGDQLLYDSLFHAHVAVGLNTSAMLEAAIVGRPVHTLVIPGFDEGQTGTMHFHYLVEAFGGLATIARDFEEHNRQLAEVLSRDPVVSPRSRHFAEQFLRPHGVDRPVSPIVTAEIERAATITKRPASTARFWHGPVRALLLSWLSRRRARSGQPGGPTLINESQSLRPVRIALEEILRSTNPVFIGPWNDSVANEVLYWIPFVKWLTETYRLPPERLIILSHDGVAEWYGPIARRYLDIRTLFSPSEFEHQRQRTVPQSEQNPKVAMASPFDTEILERAARAFDLSEYQVLHPSLMFRVVRRVARDRTTEELNGLLKHERLRPAAAAAVEGLPPSFVAVSLAYTSVLPKSEENSGFLQGMVEELAGKRDVVIVDREPPPEVAIPSSPRVHRLDVLANGKVPAELQARVLARASAFFGGYGDLSMLAACCGVPAVAYHTDRLPEDGVDRLQAAATAGEWAAVTIQRARRFKGIRFPAEAKAR
jgi:hypothetical protein